MLMRIIQMCHEFNIPMVYALNRRKMGGILRKKVPVSIVGIFSYDGAEVVFECHISLNILFLIVFIFFAFNGSSYISFLKYLC